MRNKQTSVLTVPAYLLVWWKKKYNKCYLNMNNYRNWHGILSNNAKKEFYKQTEKEIKKLPKMAYIFSIRYELIVPTKTVRDRMNVYAVVDKFFCDALQEFDIIEDDKDDMIGDFLISKKRYEKGKSEDIRVQVTIVYDKRKK